MKKESNNITSKLQFKGYEVIKLEYEKIYSSNVEENYGLMPQFMKEVKEGSNNEYNVVIGCKIEPTESNTLPFRIEVVISGKYVVEKDDPMKNELINKNSLAILFPYLRSTISMLTLSANISPLILPTINIENLFQEYGVE